MPVLQDFSATTLTGSDQPLGAYAGKVVLVVNTASECGFTRQYAGLEKLWREYRDHGLVVLGFPSDQFGQEPGDAAEIGELCRSGFDVSFPLFDKVDVNGAGAHPLFAWLRDEARGAFGRTPVRWNFTKFLVGRDGRVLARYGSGRRPAGMRRAIRQALAT